jgi:hypothetical protein
MRHTVTFFEAALAWGEEVIANQKQQLHLMKTGNMRVRQATLEHTMHDVTAEAMANCERTISEFEALL